MLNPEQPADASYEDERRLVAPTFLSVVAQAFLPVRCWKGWAGRYASPATRPTTGKNARATEALRRHPTGAATTGPSTFNDCWYWACALCAASMNRFASSTTLWTVSVVYRASGPSAWRLIR